MRWAVEDQLRGGLAGRTAPFVDEVRRTRNCRDAVGLHGRAQCRTCGGEAGGGDDAGYGERVPDEGGWHTRRSWLNRGKPFLVVTTMGAGEQATLAAVHVYAAMHRCRRPVFKILSLLRVQPAPRFLATAQARSSPLCCGDPPRPITRPPITQPCVNLALPLRVRSDSALLCSAFWLLLPTTAPPCSCEHARGPRRRWQVAAAKAFLGRVSPKHISCETRVRIAILEAPAMLSRPRVCSAE